METISHDIAHGVAQHLYVYDGDLKTQDDVQKDIFALREENSHDADQLTTLVAGTHAEHEVSDFKAARDAFRTAYSKAIKLSRQETVAGDESRDGSRGVYIKDVLPALEKLEVTGARMADVINQNLDASTNHTIASAGSAKRNVLIVALLALAAALALAIWITRLVTRPVHALSTRLESLSEHCLAELSGGLEAVAGGDLTREAASVTTLVEVTSRDEIGQLSATFNEMLGTTQSALGHTTRCAAA